MIHHRNKSNLDTKQKIDKKKDKTGQAPPLLFDLLYFDKEPAVFFVIVNEFVMMNERRVIRKNNLNFHILSQIWPGENWNWRVTDSGCNELFYF